MMMSMRDVQVMRPSPGATRHPLPLAGEGARRAGEGDAPRSGATLAQTASASEEQRHALVQEFMGARYADGYTKGVHDVDGERIFHALHSTHHALQLARYHPAARACAMMFWLRFCPAETRRRYLIL